MALEPSSLHSLGQRLGIQDATPLSQGFSRGKAPIVAVNGACSGDIQCRAAVYLARDSRFRHLVLLGVLNDADSVILAEFPDILL